MGCLTGFDVGLQGRLSVQLDGDIDHAAAFHQTVGWRVRPPASQVDAHRRAPPHDLVVTDGEAWRTLGRQLRTEDTITQQVKGAFVVATEHGIVDARHQRCRVRDGRGQRQLQLAELTGSVVEVQLVEHAVLPVAGQGRPVLTPERPSLGKEPSQVGTLCHLVAVDGIVYVIAAHLVVAVAHRHHVDALARLQTDVPVVLRHTRHHVVAGQLPARPDVAVLYPDVAVLGSERIVAHGILRENAGLRLAVVVHDVALVVDDTLDGHRRRDHLPRGAEMVELATRQRHNSHRELAQFRVVNGRFGT